MDVVGKGLKKIIFKLHKQFLLPLVVKRADKILVSSQSYFESSFIKKYAEKVKVVPFSVAVPTNELRDAREQKALFVGALDSAHYFKGVKNLLHAWLKVVEELPEAKLDIVGDGNLRGEYERYAKDLGLSDSVVFHGGVPALDKMYIEAKVSVLPSVDRSEAFGLVLLESMAEGTPIIASDLAGVNSVADSKYSQLVPPNDVEKLTEAIVESLKKPLTREDRIEVQQHVADNYSDEVVAKLLADEMNNL
jgi:rhamnosyl/mannosyltransferase